MSSKNINVLLSLVDKFSKPMEKVGASTKATQREVKKAQNTLNKFGDGIKAKLGGVASMMGQVAGAMGVMGTGAYIMDSINTFTEFDQSMKNLASTAGITADETNKDYKSMEETARRLGATTTKTAKESADAMMYMKLAGWDTADVLKNVDKVLMLSEATNMDLALASDLVTDSLSALGLQAKDTGKYMDVVAKAQQSSNTTAQSLLEAYKVVGGMFNTLNVPIEESATALGVLANRGTKSAEAGTSLQSILINLTTGAGQAGKAMETLGINAFDSKGKFKGLTNVLKELNDKTKNLTEAERNEYYAMIGGKTQVDTLNKLMQGLNTTTADGSVEWDSLTKKLKGADGSLAKMADTQRNTLGNAMKGFRSALEDTQISLVKNFAPAMTNVLRLLSSDVLPKVGVWFSNFANAIPTLVTALNILAPVMAGVIGYMVAFKVISTVVTLYSALTTVIQGATIAQGLFNAVMIANPIGLIAVAIGALIAVVVALWKNWDKVVEKVKSAFAWMGKVKDIKIFGGNSNEEPKAPAHATGTSYFKGGGTYVNEGGRGELINLPSGSQIVPSDKVKAGSTKNITVNLTVQGNLIGNEEFINHCGEAITQRLQMALGNI